MSQGRVLFVGLALFGALSSQARGAAARAKGVYLDILSAEAVGDFSPPDL